MFRPLIVGAIATAITGGHADRNGLAWSRADAPDAAANLVLSAAASDPPWLTLSCQPGSGAVDVLVAGRHEDGAIVELRSGKVWNRYGGVGAAREDGDGVFDVRVHLAAADPVLARFADTGQLRVVLGQRRIRTPNGFAPAHDFLKVCGG